MRGHAIHWLPLGVAALLALVATWLNQLTHEPDKVDHGAFAHIPDTIVTEFDALAFGTNGQPMHQLRAKRLVHYLDDSTTTLDAPVFNILDQQRVSTEAQAERGQISTGGEHIHLLDRVRVVRHIGNGRAPVTLETPYLWITPDVGTLRSDRGVTLTQGRNTVRAGALLIDDHNKHIALSGGVRGTYERTR